MKQNLDRLVIFFCLIMCVRGDLCTCASYVIEEGGFSEDNLVYIITYDQPFVKCAHDGLESCKNFCFESWYSATDGGDLNVIPPGGDETVGQLSCRYLGRDVAGFKIGVFSQACGSDMYDTKLRTKQSLCCLDGSHIQC
ncbi:uncharacterized protein LOC111087929 [Limulus polyphemus]|uniref:Uncharacterized protein LOC111087929 n=1 Tax=Limulus polyphemus TaxID=6850 RepID=A0ABM1T878_LIMPO|nr:uncharacterized protein LOC111087929 [Limulus polyphemus]